MLSAREVRLTAQREVWRNLESPKAIVMFAIFFLCGLAPRLIQMLAERMVTQLPDGTRLTDAMKREVLQKGYVLWLQSTYPDEATYTHLAKAPNTLCWLFSGTVLFVPFFILLIGFDQLAGEVQNRTLRYAAGRATRTSLVVGKALGIWAVVALMVLVLHVTVWLIVLAQGFPVGDVVLWGVYFWILSVVSTAAYVGFSSLVSALSRTPVLCLFLGFGASLAFLCFRGLLYWDRLKPIQSAVWLFPYTYDHLVVSPDPSRWALGIALYLGWGAAMIAGASLMISRRDL